MKPSGRFEHGFALVTVLWAALILALISSYLVSASRTDGRIERTIRRQAEQRALAEGVINLIMLRLFGGNQSHLPLDGATISVGYAGVSALVRIQDQAGLVDVNRAPANTLTALLSGPGKLDVLTAQTLTDRILDWREKGIGRRLNGAKASDYADAGYSYGPREGPFESVGELKLVMGMTPVVYERIAPDVTVYSQTPQVNPEVAPAEVLKIMPGMDAGMLTQLMTQRANRDNGQSVSSILDNPETRVFEITVHVGAARSVQTTLRTILRITGEQGDPAWLYAPED